MQNMPPPLANKGSHNDTVSNICKTMKTCRAKPMLTRLLNQLFQKVSI